MVSCPFGFDEKWHLFQGMAFKWIRPDMSGAEAAKAF
jgi:hypothetical protein